jgi:hypothetical protein
MSRLFQVLVLLALITMLGMTVAWAQPAGGGGGWGPGGGYGRMFNPATLETLKGEVTNVGHFTPAGRGMGQGVHLILKTATETIDVHLGPSWYLEQQNFGVAAGEKLVITGSRITYQGKPAIIASEVKKGNQVLILRNAQGVPAWSGAGRRRR